MKDLYRDFLISLDANKTRHSGRTLFDHLKGVHDLLRDWDNEYHVCIAGLFHSIYGTNTFKHQSMSDRGELIKIDRRPCRAAGASFSPPKTGRCSRASRTRASAGTCWRSKPPTCWSRAATSTRCASWRGCANLATAQGLR